MGNLSLDLHSADFANLGHCADFSLALRPKFAKNHESQTENPSVVDSARPAQNLGGNSVKITESTLDSAILQNQFFPAKKSLHFAESSKKSLPNTALIALGANLKNPIHTFKSLFTKLARNAKIHILATSPIYKNPPFGFRAQPSFYNATMMLATKMCLLEFYAFMFYLERIFGRARRRAFKNAPRALDIDIIFFNDIFMRSAKLNIPHPHWRARPSVVVPLLFQVNYKGF